MVKNTIYFPEGRTILNSCHFKVTNTIYFSQCAILNCDTFATVFLFFRVVTLFPRKLDHPFYFYLSRTCGSSVVTPSVISLV